MPHSTHGTKLLPTVLCMQWGERYGAADVNLLYRMVERFTERPHRFVCLGEQDRGLDAGIEHRPLPTLRLGADEPPSPWRKLSVFSPEVADLEGPVLFLDLDVLITGGLDVFFEHPGRFCIIENWSTRGRGIGNSSVFRFEPGAHVELFERFAADPAAAMASCDNEQTYASRAIGELTWWPEPWVRSFKVHAAPWGPMRLVRTAQLPEGCRILAFHGYPKPDEARRGHWPKSRFGLKPVPWIDDYLPLEARL